MGLSDIKQIVSSAFQAGRMDAMFDLGKRNEMVRRKDAETFLCVNGLDKCVLDKWVGDGLVREFVGEKKNSPRLYSLRELNEVALSVKIKKVI